MRIGDLGLGELRDLADATVLVAAASEAGLFQVLHEAPATAEAVAQGLGYDLRATRIVLHGLVETGLVEVDGGQFRLSARAERELGDPAGPGFVGRGLPHWLYAVRATTRLGEVLRRGGPLETRPARRTPDHVARFTSAMAAAPPERVQRIVDLCLERHPAARTVLDLGGGPGHMTRAFVARGLRGTLVDTADIVAHVQEAFGLRELEGLEVVAGDFTRDALPRGPFDLVLLSNVIHIYDGPTIATLFRQACEVLAPGGVLAVAEFLRGRSRRAAHLALQMLLKSDRGDAHSEEEIRGWMEDAGFGDVRVDALDRDRHLLTARRAD
ncbi:MAG: class I SAM-dependent methyltransferase [Gemmatimonadales bacterium]|nr:MAG: class I SAM-dependent methyltransferase [Gemmatimonadales bacterium]